MKLLFLDTETTGSNPGEDRLISVAYKTGGDMTHEFFNPDQPISIGAMATHHITEEMIADKPQFQVSPIKQDLEQLLVDHILVAHNAAFDIAMLEAEGLVVPQFICTLKVARALDSKAEIPRHGLQFLRYYWKLPVPNGGVAFAHSADGDVLVLEALYNHMERIMKEDSGLGEIDIQKKMMDISIKPSLVHRLRFGKYRDMLLSDIAHKDPGYLEWLLGEKEKNNEDPDMVYSIKNALGRS